MFTPQRKVWMSPALTPRNEAYKIGGGSNVSRSKDRQGALTFAEDSALPPPPTGTLTEAGGSGDPTGVGNMDDWRRFREAGLLSEASMERKDREAILEKIARLEKELFDYQYNMGLLLMEKKEWTTKHEELSQALQEAEQMCRREQMSHLFALSETEKREENLRKALGTQTQIVDELEKALRAMQEEASQIKGMSDRKLAEANGLVDGIDVRSLEVESKIRAAEAKLEEATRKNSELEIRMKEVEARESLLEKERLSFVTERESYETVFHKQREDLLEWERKLQKGEKMIPELKKDLNQREEKVNEKDREIKQRERKVEQAQKKIDISTSKMKEKEEDIKLRLEELRVKEKEAETLQCMLGMKEKELRALEEKLVAREGVEIQKLIDDRKAELDVKMNEFELECEEKRKSLDEELRRKVEEVEKQETEINHREEKLRKREQALDMKLERIKEKENDLDMRLKYVKERGKALEAEEKKLEAEKDQLLADRESLQNVKQEIDQIRLETTKQEDMIRKEREMLRITKEERSEHLRLQNELKQQIEKSRLEEELLLKEREGLKQEREKFEKEWEELDEKRTESHKELKKITEEKEKLERFRFSEEERLKKVEKAMRDQVKQELDDIKQQKESFEASMKHEKSALSENAKLEHSKMLQDIEKQKRDLEVELRRKQEESEKDLQEKIVDFEERSKRELNNIGNLKSVAQREMEEVRSERNSLQKEREEVVLHKEKLKVQQVEMQNDIGELGILSNNLKKRREQFIKEKTRFLAFVEKLKNCVDCGESTKEFVLSDLQLPEAETEDLLPLANDEVLNKLADSSLSGFGSIKKSSGGGSSRHADSSVQKTSWLKKCTSKLFSSPPSKRYEQVTDTDEQQQVPSSMSVDLESKFKGTSQLEVQPCPSFNPINEAEKECLPSVSEHSFMDSRDQEAPEDSQQSDVKTVRRGRGRGRGGPKRGKSTSTLPRRTKAVKEDTNRVVGESHEELETIHNDETSVGISINSERGKPSRKRQHGQSSRMSESQQDGGNSEDETESVATGGRRKRQQIVAPVVETPGAKRYNLRRHKTAGTATPQATSSALKTAEKEADGAGNAESSVPTPEAAVGTGDKSAELVQVTTIKSVEITEETIFRAETSAAAVSNEDVGITEPELKPEEVHGTSQNVEEDTDMVEKDGNHPDEYIEDDVDGDMEDDEDDDDEDEDEDEDDGDGDGDVNRGIGKKIWTFFTT